MYPEHHTFFSDPHISDPVQWFEGGEDPMLIREAENFRFHKMRREGIQLIAGTFFLVLILTITASELPKYSNEVGHAAAMEAVEEKKPENPVPAMLPPELSTQAYFVRLLGVSAPLAYQREWKQLAPASITKLVTAAAAFEKLAPETVVVISAEAKAIGQKMSKARTGEHFLRNDAIRMMLVESANDIAWALAEAIEKAKTGNNPTEGMPHFLESANAIAARAGMINSRFLNSTGLDMDGHLVTAEDFSRLMEYIVREHPEIWEMTKSPVAEAISLENRLYTLENTNELLKEFPALEGGKTGITDKAKGTLVLLYPVPPSHTALIVILGSEDRFGDGRKLIHWLEEAF